VTKKATHALTSTDAQAPQAQEGQQTAQPAAAAATTPAAGTGASVAAAPAASQATAARDAHTGQGGSYRRNPDGTRTLMARTQPAAAATTNTD
jgi:hypothetical protein